MNGSFLSCRFFLKKIEVIVTNHHFLEQRENENLKMMKKTITTFLVLIITITAFSQQAIHTSKSGNGRVLILLPGFTSPASVWDQTIEGLNGNYEIHKISYAGFNGNEPIGKPWFKPIKNAIVEYIKKEKLENFVLIGHSMGGNLATDIATSFPDQTYKLILVESIPCMRELMMPGMPVSMIQYDTPYNKQMLEMNDSSFRAMAKGMAEFMTFNKEKAELITDWMVKADRETYVYGYTDLLKLDFRETLKEIKTETLILGAAFPDWNTIKANYEKQYSNLENKELLIIENSKHFIMFDQSEWLIEQINTFLD